MNIDSLMSLVLNINDKFIRYQKDESISPPQYDVLHCTLASAVKSVKNPSEIQTMVVDNLLKEIFIHTSKDYKQAYKDSKNQTEQQKGAKKNPIGFNSNF